ncbi:hypothetical protein ACQP2U_43665 (plasmid) [Nocardia sp. CA-084685]|uniref:hypothetical protein n=1 Tax=Nocardia sp. CA-084685 TaxID=3239970 RepID=UPI003D99BE7E
MPNRDHYIGAATTVAAATAVLAVLAALDELYHRPPIRAALTRARLSSSERVEYDRLTRELADHHDRSADQIADWRRKYRAGYDPALIPDSPDQLEDFTIDALVQALHHSRAQRANASRTLDTDAYERWDAHCDALDDEARHRRYDWRAVHRLPALTRTRLDHALTLDAHHKPPHPRYNPTPHTPETTGDTNSIAAQLKSIPKSM